MRLERLGLNDREGNRNWRTHSLDGRVVGWWHASSRRVDEFGELLNEVARGRLVNGYDSVASRPGSTTSLDGVPITSIDVEAIHDGHLRRAHWTVGRHGWWFEESHRSESLGDDLGGLWRLDRPAHVHDAWLSRIMPEIVGTRTSVIDDRGATIARVDYERWLDEASQLRRRLDELVAERDRLRARWESEREADRGRIAELRSQLAAAEHETSESDSRLSAWRSEIERIERHEAALRTELRTLPETIERRVAAPVHPAWARLDRIDRRLMSWRRAQQRIERAIEKLRSELTDISMAGDTAAEAAFQRIRRGLFDFEASAEQILRVRHRIELEWPAGSDRRLPADGELKATCESLYDELHRLHERLNQRHAALARRTIGLRLRHLRRLHRDISRHLTSLMALRERTVEELSRAGVSAERLSIRAQQGFCRCAREDGYTGQCTAETAAVCTATTIERIPSARRAEVIELLRQAADRLRQLRAHLESEEPTRQEIERRRLSVERLLREMEAGDRTDSARALERLREEIDRGEARYRTLLDQISRYERGRALWRSERLDRAASWVSRVTRGRWSMLACEASGSGLLIADAAGEWHPWSQLAFETQRSIALGLCLAWNAERGAGGVWPTLLSRPLVNEDAWSAANEAVRESALLGGPIWILEDDRQLLKSWSVVAVSHELPNWVAELPPVVIPEPLRVVPVAVPRSESLERRVVVHRTNNCDAEEFPGEFRDQLMAERRVEPQATWMVEERVEAYSTGDRWDSIDDPEAWIGEWLDGDDVADGAVEERARSLNPWIERALADEPSMSSSLSRWLAAAGISKWGELAGANRERLVSEQPLVSWADRVGPWHATAELLCAGVVDRLFDARILAACGITSIRQLQEIRSFDLLHRIRSLRDADEGRRLLASGSDDELSRLCAWVKTLEMSRPLHEFGYHDVERDSDLTSHDSERSDLRSRSVEPRTVREVNHESDRILESDRSSESSRNREGKAERKSERNTERNSERSAERNSERKSDRNSETQSSRPSERNETRGSSKRERDNRERDNREHEGRERKERAPRDSKSGDSETQATVRFDRKHADRTARLVVTREDSATNERMKFYLELDHDVEAAPSVGPKSAAKLRELGIESIAEFLRADAEELAELLELPRLNGAKIREWQQQTELVCRVPNLRGHDAQILVSCEVETAEELAAFEPRKLLARIRPFTESNEGQRLLRQAPAPDLAEVTDWIRWAQNTRVLRVA